MPNPAITAPIFVIKPNELATLNYLADGHPRPLQIDWIDRGTDRKLRPSTVDMLLRTLFLDMASPSVVRLHRSAGLRAAFRSETDRDLFAKAFAAARDRESAAVSFLATAIFNDRHYAERAVADLRSGGIPERAISLLWRINQFIDPTVKWPDGHSKLGVAGTVAGSGVAGAVLGVAVMAIPGVGPVAATGAIAASAFSSIAFIGGLFGATGGALAKTLTDHDVDGVFAAYSEQQIRRGKIFVAVDTRIADGQRELIRQIFKQNGGRTSGRR